MVLHVRDEKVPLAIEADLVRLVEHRFLGRPAITGIARPARARDRRERAVRGDAPDNLPIVLAEPDRPVRTADDAERVVQLRQRGGSAVAPGSASARAGDGGGRHGSTDRRHHQRAKNHGDQRQRKQDKSAGGPAGRTCHGTGTCGQAAHAPAGFTVGRNDVHRRVETGSGQNGHQNTRAQSTLR